MMFDLLALENVRERYNDLQRQSEHERLVRLVSPQGRGFAGGMRLGAEWLVQNVFNRMVIMLGRLVPVRGPQKRRRVKELRMMR